jgi:hypothetical protein
MYSLKDIYLTRLWLGSKISLEARNVDVDHGKSGKLLNVLVTLKRKQGKDLLAV